MSQFVTEGKGEEVATVLRVEDNGLIIRDNVIESEEFVAFDTIKELNWKWSKEDWKIYEREIILACPKCGEEPFYNQKKDGYECLICGESR